MSKGTLQEEIKKISEELHQATKNAAAGQSSSAPGFGNAGTPTPVAKGNSFTPEMLQVGSYYHIDFYYQQRIETRLAWIENKVQSPAGSSWTITYWTLDSHLSTPSWVPGSGRMNLMANRSISWVISEEHNPVSRHPFDKAPGPVAGMQMTVQKAQTTTAPAFKFYIGPTKLPDIDIVTPKKVAIPENAKSPTCVKCGGKNKTVTGIRFDLGYYCPICEP